MPNTATKEQVSKDLDDMSARVSGLVRGTALGLLAVSWGLLVTPNERIQAAPRLVLSAIVLAFLALMLDWAQYLFGYLNSARTFDAMEGDENLRGWNPDRLRTTRRYLFGAKQLVTFAGVVALITAIIPAIVHLSRR